MTILALLRWYLPVFCAQTLVPGGETLQFEPNGVLFLEFFGILNPYESFSNLRIKSIPITYDIPSESSFRDEYIVGQVQKRRWSQKT